MIHTMIMAGGKGTRFWPLSRLKKAKQFLSILGDIPLIDCTIDRMASFSKPETCWILGNDQQSDCLDDIQQIPQENILREPFGKNTAACIAWGAFEALKRDPDAVLVNLSVDAWILNQEAFDETLKIAIREAEENESVVTIGIPPRSPHTGYGYIHVDAGDDSEVKNVISFKEKPDLATAEQYVQSGDYYWNAGIFVWKASVLLEHFNHHLPNHYKILKQMSDANCLSPSDVAPYYEQLENISIDYGILEKIGSDIKLVPARFDWDDIGSWSSLEPYLEKDEFNNAIRGKAVTIDSHRNIIFSNKKLVALSHINDCIVVDSDDALMIVPKAHDQGIKALYDAIPDEYK